jgi:sulfate permease, SulP family
LRVLSRIFPFISWADNYSVDSLKADVVSGLTVALVLIPQSMAYAQLAGLPSYYGLYASFLPPLVAALFGSSRQLATGPVAVVSLLTAASLEPLASAGSDGYIGYVILLTLMVGIFQFLLGLFRLGIVINFLSHPVINGFTNAAALIIASSQLSKMFGVYVDKSEHHYETILNVIKSAMHYTHWPTFLMGLLAISIIFGLRRMSPKAPGILAAVFITSIISWGADFEKQVSTPASGLVSEKSKKLIRGFNEATHGIPPLAKERSEQYKALNGLDENRDILAIHAAEYRIKVLTAHIEEHKEDANYYRAQLRSLLFKRARHTDGSWCFYPRDEMPSDKKPDGRIWRLAVGRRPLDTSLIMTSGGAVVGHVPKGLPRLTVPDINLSDIPRLLPFAAIISLLGFLEAISIAKAMAAKTGQHIDMNQELIGQGLANIFGAITKSHPTSGSFSRSAVNLQSGAVSGLSSVVTSVAVAVVLLFFTPLLYYLPQSVLAAVIIMAVVDLINVSGFIHAWHARWHDGVISIIAFVCTLVFAPHLDRGIFVGVGLSLLVFLYKSMRPAIASLSLYDDQALHDHVTYCLQECRFIEVIRFGGPLFFANATYLEDQINAHLKAKKELRHIIIFANSINDMDATGEEALSLIIDRIRSAGLDVSFAGTNRAVLGVLKRTHLLTKIGEDHFYPTIDKAIKRVHKLTHNEMEEEACPLTSVCRIPQRN